MDLCPRTTTIDLFVVDTVLEPKLWVEDLVKFVEKQLVKKKLKLYKSFNSELVKTTYTLVATPGWYIYEGKLYKGNLTDEETPFLSYPAYLSVGLFFFSLDGISLDYLKKMVDQFFKNKNLSYTGTRTMKARVIKT